MVILTISEVLNIDFRKFQPLKIAKFSQYSKKQRFKAFVIVKMALFETLDLPKMISRKI